MSLINSSTNSLKEENNFCLNGSQINLSCRPMRLHKMEKNVKLNRPVSAQYVQSNIKKDTKKYINRKRPKSADYKYLCDSPKLGASLKDRKQKSVLNKNSPKETVKSNKEVTQQPNGTPECVFSQSFDIYDNSPNKEDFIKPSENKWANYSNKEKKSLNDNLNLESMNSLESFSDHSLEEISEIINRVYESEIDLPKVFSSNPAGDTKCVENRIEEKSILDLKSNETLVQEYDRATCNQRPTYDSCKLDLHKKYFQNDYLELESVNDIRDIVKEASFSPRGRFRISKNSCDPELELVEAENKTNIFFKSFNETKHLKNNTFIEKSFITIDNNNQNLKDNSICENFSKDENIIKTETFQDKEDLKIDEKLDAIEDSESKRTSIHVRFDLREPNENISSSPSSIGSKNKMKSHEKKLKYNSSKVISKKTSSFSKGLRDTSSSSGEHCPQPVPEKVNTEKVIPYLIQDTRFNDENEIDLKNLEEKDYFLSKNENESQNICFDKDIIDSPTNFINEAIQESGDKLQDILNYLDQVDERCDHVLEIAKKRVNLEPEMVQKTEIRNLESLEILLNSSNVDLAHEIITLRLQIEEKDNCLTLLQKSLNQQRDLNVKNNKNSEKELKTRLKEQKKHYESITTRHQKFINQIIEEKNTLNEKCETLLRELQRSQEKFKSNLRAVEDRHSLEIKKLKERQAVGEKSRRTRWAEQNAQALKEATVRGLEPELERIAREHQEEIVKLRTVHRREIENLELKAARNTQQQMAELRELLERDKEEAINRECNNLRTKLSREEAAFDEEKNQIFAENKRLKEKFHDEEIRLKRQLEELRFSLERDTREVIKATQSECQSILASTERRHQMDLDSIREKANQEFSICKAELQQQILKDNELRENELKEILKKQKECEISLLMERLQADAIKIKEEIETISEAKIKRIKEKFEKEILDLEQICENYKFKWTEAKRSIVEKEEQILEAQAQVRVKEKEMNELSKLIDKYSSERSSLREIISQEFKDRIVEAEGEAARLRQDLSSLRQTQRAEEIAFRAESEQELQTVYQRVKTAVAKKDLAISKLKAKCEAADQRIQHLEALLEQNRIDYLKSCQKK